MAAMKRIQTSFELKISQQTIHEKVREPRFYHGAPNRKKAQSYHIEKVISVEKESEMELILAKETTQLRHTVPP